MKKYLSFLLIALMCILAFWQVAFLDYTLKWDILDGYLPGHYFISECLRNNIFPLWNPYQQLGFPIYADLINTNYPVNMLIARLFPYTNITFHVLFVIYLIIAGWGAYKLSLQLGIIEKVALLTGIAYPLSGFFTGNAQHMQFIIGASWLPYTILFFLKLSAEGKFKDLLCFVIFTFLLITGGYPPTAILLAYLLAIFYMFYVIKYFRSKQARTALSYTFRCLIAAVLLIVLCAGMLISIQQSTPFVNRFGGLQYETAIINPFTPQSLISIISPLTPAVHSDLFKTDLSMNNLYFGSIMVMLIMYSLFRRHNLISILLLVSGMIVLFISFGEYGFIHQFLYNHVPLFDKFKHPGNLRIFPILFFLLYAGLQVSNNDPLQNENYNVFRRAYYLFLAFILILFIGSFSVIIIRAAGPVDFHPTMKSLLNDYGIFGPLCLQTVLILFFNLIFIYIILIRQKTHLLFKVILFILAAEAIIFTQINEPYTVTAKFSPLEIRDFLKHRPQGFPLPDHHLLSENTEQSVSFPPLIHNTNTYAKTVSPYVRYPFALDGYINLAQDSTLFQNSTNNRLMYFADTILPLSLLNNFRKNINTENKKFAFVDDSAFNKFLKGLHVNSSANRNIEVTLFSPQRIVFNTHTETPQFAVLLQNRYPGWKVMIDGNKVSYFTVNYTLMGIEVPAGKHTITFEYSNNLYIYLTLFSFMLFAGLILIYMVINAMDSYKLSRPGFYLHTSGIIALMVLLFLAFTPNTAYSDKQEQSNACISDILIHETKDKNKSSFIIFNTEKAFSDLKPDSDIYHTCLRFRNPVDGIRLWKLTDTLSSEQLIYVWSNVLEIPEIPDIIQMKYPVLVNQYEGERYTVKVFSHAGTDNKPSYQMYCNNYDDLVRFWTFDSNALTTDTVFSGRYAERFTPAHEYGATFRFPVKHVPSKGIRVYAALRFLRNDDKSCHLVVAVNRNQQTVHYHAIHLVEYDLQPKTWNIAFTSQYYQHHKLRKGDEIVVYAYNSGKNNQLYIDDFLVKIELMDK